MTTTVDHDDLTDRELTALLAEVASTAAAVVRHTANQVGDDPEVMDRRRRLLLEVVADAFDQQLAHERGQKPAGGPAPAGPSS